jgi:hypothetical protein
MTFLENPDCAQGFFIGAFFSVAIRLFLRSGSGLWVRRYPG